MRRYKVISFSFFIFLHLNPGFCSGPYAPNEVDFGDNSQNKIYYKYDTASNRLTNTSNATVKQTITMGLLTKPQSIKQENAEPEQFFFGVGGQRYLRIHEDMRKTLYLNGMEYRLWNDKPTFVVHIRAKGYSPDVQVEWKTNEDPRYIYLLKDHLGSPVRTVGGTGDPVRFDPWGQRIAATGAAVGLNSAKDAENTRGYTGHEFIASANMGHWNGRLFDYEIGAFLGPDLLVQGRSTASLNRFALGQNKNPNVVDPSGWAGQAVVDILGDTLAAADSQVTTASRGDHIQKAIFSPNNNNQGILISKKTQMLFDKHYKPGMTQAERFALARKAQDATVKYVKKLRSSDPQKLLKEWKIHVLDSSKNPSGSPFLSITLNEASAGVFAAHSGPDGAVFLLSSPNSTLFGVHGIKPQIEDVFQSRNLSIPVGEFLVAGGVDFHDVIAVDTAFRQHPSTYRNYVDDLAAYLPANNVVEPIPSHPERRHLNIEGLMDFWSEYYEFNTTHLDNLNYFPPRQLN